MAPSLEDPPEPSRAGSGCCPTLQRCLVHPRSPLAVMKMFETLCHARSPTPRVLARLTVWTFDPPLVTESRRAPRGFGQGWPEPGASV